MTKPAMRFALMGVLALTATAAWAAPAGGPVDLKKAALTYYSLHRQGFQSASCGIHPDWSSLLKTLPDADRARAVQKLDTVRFDLTVDADGVANVAVTAPPAGSPEEAKGIAQMSGGMKEMMDGFFKSWSMFVIGSPFPEPGVAVDDHATASGRELKYNDHAAEVTEEIAAGNLITEVRVHDPRFNSSMRPRFVADPGGLLLSGYNSDFIGADGSDATKLDVTIENQSVNGLKFPSMIGLQGSFGGSFFDVRLNLTGCRILRR